MKTNHVLWLVAMVLLCGCQSTRYAGPSARVESSAITDNVPARVVVKGIVRYPFIQWTEDLTVARAIVTAEYLGARDPIVISIRRGRESFYVDPARLALGIVDPWLEPGDIVELHTSTASNPPYGLYTTSILQDERAGSRVEDR